MKRIAVMLAAALLLPSVLHAQEKKQAPKTTQATWWGHAAWVIETPGGAKIALDPWLENPKAPKGAAWPKALDAILISHGHFDHVGNASALAKNTGAQVFGSFELVSLLKPEKAVGANIGGSFQVKDATIHLVEAVHSSGYGDAEKGELKYAGNPMGYVIAVANGPTIYFAGDTDVFSSMALIGQRFKPTVALLPIGGHFTMDPVGAAHAAKLLGVKTVVPMHYGTFDLLKGTPAQLENALKKQKVSARVQVVEPGKALTFK